jgi:hypothetical protein
MMNALSGQTQWRDRAGFSPASAFRSVGIVFYWRWLTAMQTAERITEESVDSKPAIVDTARVSPDADKQEVIDARV